jgi:hypothetical protein
MRNEVGNFIEMVPRGNYPAHPGWTRALHKERELLEVTIRNRLTAQPFPTGDENDSAEAMATMPTQNFTAHRRNARDFRRLRMSSAKVNNDEEGRCHHNGGPWYVKIRVASAYVVTIGLQFKARNRHG